MNPASFLMLGAAIMGVMFSTWTARPIDASALGVWTFALLWSSLGWCILVVLSLLSFRAISIRAPLGALAVLLLSEVVLLALGQDPLLLAVKPLYQVPGVVIGAVYAHLGFAPHRAGHDA